jgi:hypothetical protein
MHMILYDNIYAFLYLRALANSFFIVRLGGSLVMLLCPTMSFEFKWENNPLKMSSHACELVYLYHVVLLKCIMV